MAELGTYLVSGREQAGMTATDISQVTRIPVKTLEALEQERWSDLPEAAFVRGFVVNYCKTVGLDDGPALETLATVVRERRGDPRAMPIPDPGPSSIRLSSRRGFAVNWAFVAILLVFAVGIVVAVLLTSTKSVDDLTILNAPPHPIQTSPGKLPNG